MNGVPEPETGSPEPPSAASSDRDDLLGRRVGAALIDLALLVAVFAILAATIGESSLDGSGFSFELDGADAALYLALVLLYYFALEAAVGQTVGKLLVGLRVVRASGSRPSAAAIAVRTLLRVVDWLPLLYLVGFIATLVSGSRRQRLGDLAARTSVARTQPVAHPSLAAAAVALVVLVLLGLSFYRASGDKEVAGSKAETTATVETLALEEGRILVQDDFSDPTSGWDNEVFKEGETVYGEGAYRILVKAERLQMWSNIVLEPRREALRLNVEATQLAGKAGDLVGARCYTDVDANEGYILGISPAERGGIVAAFLEGDYRLLESWPEPVDAVSSLREENQLRVECVSSPDGPTVLTLAVNGEFIFRAEDETGRGNFDAVGLFVDTTEGGAEALFDDIVVTELVPR